MMPRRLDQIYVVRFLFTYDAVPATAVQAQVNLLT